MSCPRYPAYQDSGVEWLGEVPGHWDVKRLRFVAELNPSKSEAAIIDRDTLVSFLPMDAIGEDGLLRLDIEKPIGELESGYTYFRNGDVTIAKITPCYENGKGALMKGLVNGMGFGTTELIVARPKPEEVTGAYLHYLFISPDFRDIGESHMYGAGGQKRVPDAFVRDFATAFPPLPEQTQIATFLDRETAKIDALVAEQRRLMALLKEKRQAVISHAVTRGLNPRAPLKPSGIEWLGDVPEHWDVLKGALIGTLFGSEQVPEDAVLDEGDLPFIKVGSLSRDSFEIESWDYFVDSSVAANYRPRSGYIVFPKRGAAIFTNKVNIVDRPSLVDPNLMGWKIGERAVTAFIAYALKCRKLDELADVSTVPQINNKHIAPERFAVPPIEEQHQIVAYLNAESAKFDTLTTEAQRAIDLLQERRTALISAAVTGQIDVREAAYLL